MNYRGVACENNWLDEVTKDKLRLLAYLTKGSLKRAQLYNQGFTPQRISSVSCLIPKVIQEDYKTNKISITNFGINYYNQNKNKM